MFKSKEISTKKMLYKVFLIFFALIIFLTNNVNAETEDNKEIKTLIVETDYESVFDQYEEIVSVNKILNGLYSVYYKNEEDANSGLIKLKNNKLIKNICKDIKVSIPEKKEETKKKSASLSVDPENFAWGVESTGIKNYLLKIDNLKNKEDIKIGVLDTGVNYNHEAFLEDNNTSKLDLTNAYNFIDNSRDVYDDFGHGTEVAGIIAQSTPKNVKIVPVKVLDETGMGDLEKILDAVTYISDKVDIINLSLGIEPSEMDETLFSSCEKVFRDVYNKGVIIVCASGNEGKNTVFYPASSQYTFAVSAIDKNRIFASFSNYGNEIDFALPGVVLRCPYYSSNYAYKIDSGTSFSSPFLSSAIALIKTEYPNYTISQIKDILKQNSEDLGTYGKDSYYGYGSLNFNLNMFKKPGISSIEIDRINNKISVNAYSGSRLLSYSITNSEDNPQGTEWKDFYNKEKEINFDIYIYDYGIYYIWLKNEEGYVTKKEFEYNIFDDISFSNWYYKAVKYTYDNNILKGLNNTTFGPNNKLTRGMMVTILYRMENEPKITGEPKFLDVKDSSKYYYKAVKWAADNKIVSGYQDGRFGPTDNITREQLAVILYKYARYKGKDLSKTDNLESFIDSNKVSNYATLQIKWAVGTGIITGNVNNKTGEKTINPKENATRAEVAAMMEKYCKRVGR